MDDECQCGACQYEEYHLEEAPVGKKREKKVLIEGGAIWPLVFLPWLVGVIEIARWIIEGLF